MYKDLTNSSDNNTYLDIIKALNTVVCEQDLELDFLINRFNEWTNVYNLHNKVHNSLNLIGTFLDFSTKANNVAISKMDTEVESALVDMTLLIEKT